MSFLFSFNFIYSILSAGLYITSISLANASKIFHWRITDTNYLPAGDYIKHSWYFSKTLNSCNLSVKYDVICSIKLDFLIIFVTDLLLIYPVLSKSTWFDKCKWPSRLDCGSNFKRKQLATTLSSDSKTGKTKKTKCKIMPKIESRILKKVVGFFSPAW